MNKISSPRISRPAVLKEGFSTGTAAAAAASAALLVLFGERPERVETPLPPFEAGRPAGFLSIPIFEYVGPRKAGDYPLFAEAMVRKDGGDDPDATRHALIRARVELFPGPGGVDVAIEGGEGIGRVTLPGLPVPVGRAAINPVPMAQIEYALRIILATRAWSGRVEVLLSVPGGEALAAHTLNARLGILGGISILGTHGLVKPFSHEAWRETIRSGLDVARAAGCPVACLSTGRRSERLLRVIYNHLPEQAFIQAADFVFFSLKEAGRREFKTIVWGCFFGKLLKLAQGLRNTHAGKGRVDFDFLALLCEKSGLACAEKIKNCIAANHALDLMLEERDGLKAVRLIAEIGAERAAEFAGGPVRIHLFHLNGAEILSV